MLQTEQEQGRPKGLMPCLEYWFLSITARDEAQQNPQCESAGSIKSESSCLLNSYNAKSFCTYCWSGCSGMILETTVGACRNHSRVLGESIRGSRDRGVLVLSFCVHPCPSLLPGEVLAAVQKWLCEGCSHSQDKSPWALQGRTLQAVCVRRVGALWGLSV